eukprot:TRINITY_DN2548_c0_g1_i1.p1 TRINITY_DN2548_c0_g1~~TRINITY_DN2548_c0_g1_i1.p1  ORF type:complete len:153 (-),score=10.12 TRINITY_DN2548_c0_g1_i1:131-589(-)
MCIIALVHGLLWHFGCFLNAVPGLLMMPTRGRFVTARLTKEARDKPAPEMLAKIRALLTDLDGLTNHASSGSSAHRLPYNYQSLTKHLSTSRRLHGSLTSCLTAGTCRLTSKLSSVSRSAAAWAARQWLPAAGAAQTLMALPVAGLVPDRRT